MDDVSIAIVLAACLSVVLALIEVQNESKSKINTVLKSLQFWVYVFLLGVGNTASTLASASVTDSYLSQTGGADASPETSDLGDEELNSEPAKDKKQHQELPGRRWFWYVFFGVFGFQGLIRRINITVSDVGVLSIHDWIDKAKNIATADAIELQVHAKESRATRYAETLKQIPLAELKAHLLAAGMDPDGIEQRANAIGADAALTLAIEFAFAEPEKARALIE